MNGNGGRVQPKTAPELSTNQPVATADLVSRNADIRNNVEYWRNNSYFGPKGKRFWEWRLAFGGMPPNATRERMEWTWRIKRPRLLRVPVYVGNDDRSHHMHGILGVFRETHVLTRVRIDECEIAHHSTFMKDGVIIPHDYRNRKNRRIRQEMQPTYPTLIGYWEDVIMVQREEQNYGHWHIDKITAILALPQDLLPRAYVVAFSPCSFVTESLGWIGITEDRIIYLHPGERLAAHHVWTMEPYPWYQFCPPLSFQWRDIVKKKANLDQQPPTRFGFQNRYNREILNLTETLQEVQWRFPKFPWEMLPQQWGSILETAKEMNRVKFLLTPHGSNLANIYYMQPMTVFCDVQKPVLGWYFFGLGMIFRIRSVYCVVGKQGGPCRLSRPLAFALVKAALRLVREQFEEGCDLV
jgi:hypothetical protein